MWGDVGLAFHAGADVDGCALGASPGSGSATTDGASDGARDGGARARGGPSDGVAGIGLGANARATDEDSNENARLMTSSLD